MFVLIRTFFMWFLYQFVHCLYKSQGRSPSREGEARATRAKPEPRGWSPSTPPAPTRPHPAAPTLGYTWLLRPLGYTRLPRRKVTPGYPDQLGCVHGGVGLEMGLRLPSEKWDCTNSSVWHIVNPFFHSGGTFPQESGFLFRRNFFFTPSGILSVPGLHRKLGRPWKRTV
jgi:hypothetical protein